MNTNTNTPATVTTAAIRAAIELRTTAARSAWARGVAAYALDLLDDLDENGHAEINPNAPDFEKTALFGAPDWNAYSVGGCSFIYDEDIVARLCPPSEIRRFNAGKLDRPNARESWLDCQARALYQAFRLIVSTAREIAAATANANAAA